MRATKTVLRKQLLDIALKDAVKVLHSICPHEKYTTYPDPTCHRCNLCGDYLATDSPDGTGKVLVPHRGWKP